MKIPKHIEKLIERRCRLAMQLNSADCNLADWLEKNDVIQAIEEYDIYGGCEMYTCPQSSAERIRKAIMEHGE